MVPGYSGPDGISKRCPLIYAAAAYFRRWCSSAMKARSASLCFESKHVGRWNSQTPRNRNLIYGKKELPCILRFDTHTRTRAQATAPAHFLPQRPGQSREGGLKKQENVQSFEGIRQGPNLPTVHPEWADHHNTYLADVYCKMGSWKNEHTGLDNSEQMWSFVV